MKKILLLLFIFSLSLQLTAQVTLVIESESSSIEGSKEEDEIIAKTTILNNSSEMKTVLWERNILSLSEGWETSFCDKNVCYNPDIDAFEFDLDSMEQAEVSVYGYPKGFDRAGEGIDGATTVEIKFTDAGDPNNTVTGTFDVQTEGFTTTSTRFASKPNIKIYPNPTSQYISLTEATNVNRLMVYNIVGRPVKSFWANTSNQYDVSNLPIGIYLVRLMDRYEQTIKTIRLRVNYP